jgi:DNA invertase Pin-like site-specific DNA recombinase
MRVAIYARVSTDDKGQDPENQLGELRAWVTNSGHKISHEYVDYESGRKGTEKRKQFAALFDDAANAYALTWNQRREIVYLATQSRYFGPLSKTVTTQS